MNIRNLSNRLERLYRGRCLTWGFERDVAKREDFERDDISEILLVGTKKKELESNG